MGGDQWHCSKCTFLHHFPGQRCTMCNALRVSKEEMRNFVHGKKIDENEDDDNRNVGGRRDINAIHTNQQLHRPAIAVENPYARNQSPSNNVATSIENNFIGRHGKDPHIDSISRGATMMASMNVTGPIHSTNNGSSSPPQQHQQRPLGAVNNPYSKSQSATVTAVSHSNNVSLQNNFRQPQHNSFAAAAPSLPPPPHPNQHAAQPNNSNNAHSSSNVSGNQQHQNIHSFFTGGGARPITTAQSFQRSQKTYSSLLSTTIPTSTSAAAAITTTTLTTSTANRQRFSLSAKKQLPYIQGPVPLCTSTCHNWIYPLDDKYPERAYQLEISQSAIFFNTLVSLPTGLGKTLIAAVVMYNYYRWFPQGKIVFCAPTRPLVTQQIQACYNIMGIPERHTAEISGRVLNTSRKKIWDNKRVFFCTPQTLVKDIEEDRCDATKIVCIVLDEAHRATGRHPTALLSNMIEEAGGKFRMLALSATPGTDIKSIQAVVETLKISRIEARTEDDPNVKRYIHNREEEVISVQQPDGIKILDKKLLEFVRQPLERLRSVNAANRLMGDSANLSPFAVMKAREEYVQRTGDHRLYHTFEALRSLVDVRINLKNHGIQYALQNIARKEMEAKGPLRSIFHSDEFKALKSEMQVAAGDPTECLTKNNPKYEKLAEVLVEHFERKQAIGESTRAIVFSQLRESVMGIVSMLSLQNSTLIKPTPFIGQSNKKKDSESNPGQEIVAGMNQAQQQRILQKFNDGGFNVLVCTCVGEEGLDIGDVDLIVNFDILKSAIRSIQRIGRTGRKRNGRVIFLVSEGQEERSYRDSVTNSKKIARALKDPSVFKLCQNYPMFPDEPALMRQKMVVDDFHMSQIGGHTPKLRGSTRLIAEDHSWKLSSSEQNERINLFGCQLFSLNTEYETETTRCNFPTSLRKKFLKARRGSQQVNKSFGRGRSSAILVSLEKSYMHSTEIRGRIDVAKQRFIEDDKVCNSSVEEENHNVVVDVDSVCGFEEHHPNEPSEDDLDDFDLNMVGCNRESNSKDSLEVIFGLQIASDLGCLDSQQIAYLFDSEEHKLCSVKAPPPFGDSSSITSNSYDESSSILSEPSKQSHMPADVLDDDDLCAFFENSQRQQRSVTEMQPVSMGEAYNDDRGADYDEEINNGADSHTCNFQSDPEIDPAADVELNASVTDGAQNVFQHILDNNGVWRDQGCPIGIPTMILKSNDESLVEVERLSRHKLEPDGDSVHEYPVSELQKSICGISPIAPQSPVAAFRLPTPPPSSDEDDEDDCDDDNDVVEKEVIEGGEVVSSANEHDIAASKPSPANNSSLPLEINDARGLVYEFEPTNQIANKQSFCGTDEQVKDSRNKIDPLQLPTQYSSSSSDDDDDVDESEALSECEANAEMQSSAINDFVTNELRNIQHEQKYAIGTKISKEFRDPTNGQLRLYRGEIRAYYSQDNQDKLYNVFFEDGDCEDLEEDEIEMYLALNEASQEDTMGRQTHQSGKENVSQHVTQKMSPLDDLTDTPVKAIVGVATGAISRMSLESLTDTPVVQRIPDRKAQMSLGSLTDTPAAHWQPERKSRKTLESLTDTPVQHLPERKRMRPASPRTSQQVSKHVEKVSKQERLKKRIEEKYRCRFLDTEAANEDSDSGDEQEEEDDEMSHDSFINDTSQLGYSQDDLDRLNESVEECDPEESDTLHRQLDHQRSVRNQFKTPIFNRRMQLPRSQQSQTSLPPSQRGLGNMNFIRSVIDHHRQGGDCDEIEEEYHRLIGESSQEISASRVEDEFQVDSPVGEEEQQTQTNNAILRVGLRTQHGKNNAVAPNASTESVCVKASHLTAEQKAMIEAKRMAALRLRHEKMNQEQTQQVRFNPYAK